jgi:hypothetical protein
VDFGLPRLSGAISRLKSSVRALLGTTTKCNSPSPQRVEDAAADDVGRERVQYVATTYKTRWRIAWRAGTQ